MDEHDPATRRRDGASPELTIDVARQDGHAVVRVGGDVDLASVATLRRRFHDLVVGGDVQLAVDLSQVTFMDSAGLASLVGLYKQVRMFRGTLTLVAPSRPVRRIIEITALDRVFTMSDEVPVRPADPPPTSPDVS